MEPVQITGNGKTVLMAFAVGAAEMLGMYAAILILKNRQRITDYTKRMAQHAIQEAR